MNFKLTIFSLFLTLNYCLAMKADDICLMSKKEMKKCDGKYWNQCGSEHCSVDKNSCKNFLYSSFIVKSMKILKTYEKESESILMFLEGVGECPTTYLNINEEKSIVACIKGILNLKFLQIIHLIDACKSIQVLIAMEAINSNVKKNIVQKVEIHVMF